jgi:CO/xanthine dehydrogenase Mo-binding subunit
MGMSFAILENLIPNYPMPTHQPHSLADYMIATAMDIPDIETVMVKKGRPSHPSLSNFSASKPPAPP